MLWRAELSTWHGSFTDLILLTYLTQQQKTPTPHTKQIRVISHPFTSSPNPSENRDGFNTVYSSLRTWVRFTLSTCRTCDICYLQQPAVIAWYRTRPWCSLYSCCGKLTYDEDTGWPWADWQFYTYLYVLCWLLLFIHRDFSAGISTEGV